MAEVLTATKTQVAQTAGKKMDPTAHNRIRSIVITTPAAWSAANGDTAATGILIPKGSRILSSPVLSGAAGAASSTVSLGLRNFNTKVANDATAVMAATAITSAATGPINTGTKIITGQDYVLTEDSELYLTFGGATPQANQALRFEVYYVAP